MAEEEGRVVGYPESGSAAMHLEGIRLHTYAELLKAMNEARRERMARAARVQLASFPLHTERELVGPK
eukprot:2844834-Pyramimonas_sp.AAC.1